MIKRFFTVLTIMLCIAALVMPQIMEGTMTSSVSEQQLVEYLIKNGYPTELIELMPYAIKLNSYNEGATFQRVEYLTEGGIHGNEPGLLAYISNYSAWFMVENVSAPSGYTRKRITYSWAWLFSPSIWTLTDHVVIKWNDSAWYVVGTPARMYRAQSLSTHYREYLNTTSSACNQWENQLVSFPHDLVESFVCQHCGNVYGATDHNGWVQLTLEKQGSTTTPFQVFGKYFYQSLPLLGDVTFKGVASHGIWRWVSHRQWHEKACVNLPT